MTSDEYNAFVKKASIENTAAMLAAGRWFYGEDDRMEKTCEQAIEYARELANQIDACDDRGAI